MSYQRFVLPGRSDVQVQPATVATSATLRPIATPTVARLASVAGRHLGSEVDGKAARSRDRGVAGCASKSDGTESASRRAYASQSEDALDRSRRRLRKIRGRLGDANLLVPFPPKPKSMRVSTYTQMRGKAVKAKIRTGPLFDRSTAALLARIKRFENKRSFW